MSTATKDQTNTERLTLPVQGMSCAACVRRVEKALAGVDGVQDASVNLATEKATMVFDPAHAGLDAMKQAVEEAGYELVEPEPDAVGAATEPVRRDVATTRRLRAKAMFAVAFGGVILLLSFAGAIPAIGDFAGRGFLIWLLATPVQFWAGWQFYSGAWSAIRHLNANMHTLDCGGHQRRLPLQRRRAAVSRFLCRGRRRRPVFRYCRGHHRADPGRPLPGGSGTQPDLGRDSAVWSDCSRGQLASSGRTGKWIFLLSEVAAGDLILVRPRRTDSSRR